MHILRSSVALLETNPSWCNDEELVFAACQYLKTSIATHEQSKLSQYYRAKCHSHYYVQSIQVLKGCSILTKQFGYIEGALFLEGTREELITNVTSRAETSGRSDDSLDVSNAKLDAHEASAPSVLEHFEKLKKAVKKEVGERNITS